MVSADVQSSSQDLVAEANASAFITKPVDRQQLLAVRVCWPRSELNAVRGRAHRAAEHWLRPRRRVVVAAHGHRVLLEVPQVTLQAVDEVGESLARVVQGQVASVHQIFNGPVAGDALLILDESGAAILKELLTNEPALPLSIDASAREVITEIGNILLNACLGTFGNLLKVQVSFSVPHLNLASVAAILATLRVGQEGVHYALVVQAGFKLRDAEVRGYLVIVLSVASLDRLIRAVEEWEHHQR